MFLVGNLRKKYPGNYGRGNTILFCSEKLNLFKWLFKSHSIDWDHGERSFGGVKFFMWKVHTHKMGIGTAWIRGSYMGLQWLKVEHVKVLVMFDIMIRMDVSVRSNQFHREIYWTPIDQGALPARGSHSNWPPLLNSNVAITVLISWYVMVPVQSQNVANFCWQVVFEGLGWLVSVGASRGGIWIPFCGLITEYRLGRVSYLSLHFYLQPTAILSNVHGETGNTEISSTARREELDLQKRHKDTL